ncbi:hypothetical protein B0T10DRAFT_495105 [Thelonectria olida]|uniref:Uncharacterized protein n=1 Tax=Thelonectria olida TaxID=1576542 RepID=A0A9P8VYG5_9HYPO|nr:hypothetical protein B0T10DRAFT_495105 [Thelonectria olida]
MTTTPVQSVDALREEFAFLNYQSQLLNDQAGLTVTRDAYWSYCGPLLDPSSLPSNFSDFAASTFTRSLDVRFLPFLEFINAFIVSSGLSHYFLTIRATTPTHEYDRPRWHTDELFFSQSNDGKLPGTGLGLKSQYERTKKPSVRGTDWKICTSLLGPPTLFIPLEHQFSARQKQTLARKAASTEHDCLSIRCVGCASAAERVREELSINLKQFGAKTATFGECALFKVGRDRGAMHSEPCMSEHQQGRVFVNVIPGTKEELEVIMRRWGMEFPRQWWVAKPHVR